MAKIQIPKIGDIIYIDSAGYVDSSFRDVTGGKVRIQSVEKKGDRYWVVVEEFPTSSYSWEHLSEMQEYLKGTFGDTWAHKG